MNKLQEDQITSYDNQIWGIDIHEGHIPGRTSSYLIKGTKTALIETGSSICQPYLLKGLKKLGVALDDIDYVIVTHIHLDHSGGAGTLLPHLPNATVVVHPRGARHLIDPTRLIEGAKAAYGDRLSELFGDIAPIPESRILIRNDGDTLDLGADRVLTFYDTPGHAKHHFSIWDPETRSVFCGDTFGLRFVPQFTGWDFIEYFPSTSPSDFDPIAIEQSTAKISKLNPSYLYHAHFGRSDDPEMVFARNLRIANDFDRLGRELYRPGIDPEELEEALRSYILKDLASNGHPEGLSLHAFEMDLQLNARGILHKVSKE